MNLVSSVSVRPPVDIPNAAPTVQDVGYHHAEHLPDILDIIAESEGHPKLILEMEAVQVVVNLPLHGLIQQSLYPDLSERK